jgi:hypothetical protein
MNDLQAPVLLSLAMRNAQSRIGVVFLISRLTFLDFCRKSRESFPPHGVPPAHGDFLMRGCFATQGFRVLDRLGPRRDSRMDRIGTIASLQLGSTIIIVMVDRGLTLWAPQLVDRHGVR